MIIGKFESAEDGAFEGFIQTICAGMDLKLIPNTKGADYTVTTDFDCEAGAAWKRTSNDGKEYVSVRLDSPFLPAPINCALFEQKDGAFRLVWDRLKPKPDDRKSGEDQK
jgi:uncharacterized protein (DUF736 family)